MNVMIFAAGFGSRMRPLTKNSPKPLIKVAGKPLLDHALEQASASAPQTVVVNGHYLSEQVDAYISNKPGVVFVDESPEVLETGGGLKNALPILGPDPVLTLNSDAVWLGPSAASILQEAWSPEDMDAILLLAPPASIAGTPGGWRFTLDETGKITRSEQGLVYLGAAIMKTDGLMAIPKEVFSLRELWLPMLENGRLGGVVYPGLWADVGTPEGIQRAERMLDEGRV